MTKSFVSIKEEKDQFVRRFSDDFKKENVTNSSESSENMVNIIGELGW